MILERSSQVESRRFSFEADRGIERRLVVAGWKNPLELMRAVDCVGLCLTDFSDRLSGVAVAYLRQCAAENKVPCWSDAATYLRRFAVLDENDLYLMLVETPSAGDDSATDLVEQVRHAAADRAIEDCRYATREVTLLVLHALSCPRCQRCAKSQRHVLPRSAGPSQRQRKAVVRCG